MCINNLREALSRQDHFRSRRLFCFRPQIFREVKDETKKTPLDFHAGSGTGDGNGLQATLDIGSGYNINGIQGLSDNEWHTAIVSHDRDGNMTVYVDGVVAGSVDISADAAESVSTSFYLFVGCYNDSSGGTTPLPSGLEFSGQISDVALWHHAVTLADAHNLTASLGAY